MKAILLSKLCFNCQAIEAAQRFGTLRRDIAARKISFGNYRVTYNSSYTASVIRLEFDDVITVFLDIIIIIVYPVPQLPARSDNRITIKWLRTRGNVNTLCDTFCVE